MKKKEEKRKNEGGVLDKRMLVGKKEAGGKDSDISYVKLRIPLPLKMKHQKVK